jgi:DNA anti-recombination protein RmuC
MGLLDKAVDAAKKVADAAQEGLSEAKDKGQELVLKRKINGFAEEIGHLVARQKGGESGLDGEIDRLVGEMRAAEAEIKALEEA